MDYLKTQEAPKIKKINEEHIQLAEKIAFDLIDRFTASQQNQCISTIIQTIGIDREKKINDLKANIDAIIKTFEELKSISLTNIP